jgi:branched-chain amino acid aminotransferase
MRIWIDGEFVPQQDAKISVYDHGLLYGDGVFEGIRIYNKRIFKCRSHIDRLYRSAELIHLKIPYTKEEMDQIMRSCIETNNITDGYIRLVVTRGFGDLGLNPFLCKKPTVICIADKIELYPESFYENGLGVVVAKRIRVDPRSLDPSVKSLNYLNNILAKIEAINEGKLEAIMLNSEGKVSECTGDNIFIVKDGAVHTPPTSAHILHGITRAFVLELCGKLGITAVEREMELDEVKNADEIFLTGTAAEIIAVTQVGDMTVGDGKRGPVTARLNEAFRDAVRENCPED